MSRSFTAPPLTEILSPRHDRAGFACGSEALDRYLKMQATQDAKRNLAAPFVMTGPDSRIIGYYTLSSTAVQLAALPGDVARRLPRYPLIPATLLGRLAVDQRFQGQGHGRLLLADALWRAVRSEIASFAVIVDAKDEAAKSFYRREGFLAFADASMRLYRPMSDIARLFELETP